MLGGQGVARSASTDEKGTSQQMKTNRRRTAIFRLTFRTAKNGITARPVDWSRHRTEQQPRGGGIAMRLSCWFAAVACWGRLAVVVSASPIPGLFNTGVDNGGNLLP